MTFFDDRERAFEAKFVHECELDFRVIAVRNRLLAEWASDVIGMTRDAREAYVRSMINHAASDRNPEDILHLVGADLELNGHIVTASMMRRKIGELTQLARTEVFNAPLADVHSPFH